MSVRETGALLALGVLGGTWAAAVGMRRSGWRARTAMLDARTGLQVRLDALRSRTAELSRRDLPPEAKRLVDRAVEDQVLIDAVLSRAASVDEVDELVPQIDDALESLDQAAALVGIAMPASRPFAGLCSTDPAHGTAGDDPSGLCSGCREATQLGQPRPIRMVTVGGRPIPFTSISDLTLDGSHDGPERPSG